MNQFSSSSDTVKAKRNKKGLESLDKAARNAGEAAKKEGTAQNQGHPQGQTGK